MAFFEGTEKTHKKPLSIAFRVRDTNPELKNARQKCKTLKGSAECRMWVADISG
jgi:hypothetical protein